MTVCNETQSFIEELTQRREKLLSDVLKLKEEILQIDRIIGVVDSGQPRYGNLPRLLKAYCKGRDRKLKELQELTGYPYYAVSNACCRLTKAGVLKRVGKGTYSA